MGNGDGGGVLAVPPATPASMGGLATATTVSGRFLGPELLALSSHGGHHLFINRIPPRLPKEDVEKIILSQLRLHPFALQVSKCSVIPQNSLKNKGYGFITLDGSPTPDDLDVIANSLNNKLQVGCRTLGVRVCTDCHNALLAEDDVGAFSSSPGSSPPNEPGGCDMQEAHGRAIINAQSAGADDRPCGGAVPLQSSLLQSAAVELARQSGPGGSSRRRKAPKQQHEQGAVAEPGPRHPHHQQQHHQQQELGHHQPNQQGVNHSHHSKHRHEQNQQFFESGRGRPSRVQRPQGGAHAGERERARQRPCLETVCTPRPEETRAATEDSRATVADADRDEIDLGSVPVHPAASVITVGESPSAQAVAAAGPVQQLQRPQARAVQLHLDAVVQNRHGQATGSASSPRSVSSSGSCSGFGSGPASASGFVSVGSGGCSTSVGSGGCSTSGPASVSGSGLGQVFESGLVCSLSSGALDCREGPMPGAAPGQSGAEDKAKVARAAMTSPPQLPAAAAAMAAGAWVGDAACLSPPASAHAAGDSSADVLSPAGVLHRCSRNQAASAHLHQHHHQEQQQQQQQLHQQIQRPHMRQQQQLPLTRGGSGGSPGHRTAGHNGRGGKAPLGLAVPSTAPHPLTQPAAAQPLPGPPPPTPMAPTAAAASHQPPPPQLYPSHLHAVQLTVQARNARSTSHGVYGGGPAAAAGTCAAKGHQARGSRASGMAHDRNGSVHHQRSQPPPQPQPQQPTPLTQQSKQLQQQQGLSGPPHQAHRHQQTGGQGLFSGAHANGPAASVATIRHQQQQQQYPSQQQHQAPPQQQPQQQFRPGCGRAGDGGGNIGGMAAYGRGRQQAAQMQDFEQGSVGGRHHQQCPTGGWVRGVGGCGVGGGASEDVSMGRAAVSALPGSQAHAHLQQQQLQHRAQLQQQQQPQHGQGGHCVAVGAQQQPQQAFLQSAHPRAPFQPVAAANGVLRPQQHPPQQHQQQQQQQQHSHGGRQPQHRQHQAIRGATVQVQARPSQHQQHHFHQHQHQRHAFGQPCVAQQAGAGAGGGAAAAAGGPASLETSPTSSAALLQLQLLLGSSGPRSEAARTGSPSLHTVSAPPGLGSSWRAASLDLDLDLDVHRSRLEATAADPLALGPIGSIQSQFQGQGPAPASIGRVAASVEPLLLLARGSSDGLADPDPAEADALDSTELNPLHLEPMILQLLENDDEDDAAAAVTHGSSSLKGYTRPGFNEMHRGAHQGFGCHPAGSCQSQPGAQQQEQPKQYVLASVGCGSEVSLSPPLCGSAGGISGLDAWGLMRSKSVSSSGGGGAGVGTGASNGALAGATGVSPMCGVAAAIVAAWGSLAPAGAEPVSARSCMTEEREERTRGGGGAAKGVGVRGVGGGFRTLGVHQARGSLGAGGGGGDGGHFGPPGLLATSLPNANLLMMMQRFQT